jgi:outer membrane receptor protein involved in Fe transport
MRMLVLTALLSAGWLGVARAQEEIALVDRGPHFLFAPATHAAPRPVDVARTAVLRQQIALDLDDVSLPQALNEITRQTGLAFVYTRDILPVDGRVHVKAEQITVAAALTEILLEAHVDVLLSSQRQAALVSQPAPAPPGGTVTGRVTDAKTKQAIAGTVVWLEGTRWRASTDADGRYRLTDVTAGTYTLNVRRIGYARRTQSITVAAGEEVSADIALEASAMELEQLVVTGTIVPTERKALPSPITVISDTVLRQMNLQRVDQLFRGTIPGAISYDVGADDWLARIFTRGTTDLNGLGSLPKVYIDGIEFNDPSFLPAIDPASIEHLEFIRGPEASTLYGSQALNGVLQVFTKKGERNQPQPRVDATASMSSIAGPLTSGDHLESDASGAIRGGSQDFSYNIGGSNLHTGEWLPHYSSDRNSFYSGLSGTIGKVTADFSGRFLQRRVHSSQTSLVRRLCDAGNATLTQYFCPIADDDQYDRTATFGANLAYAPSPMWRFNVRLGYDRLQQQFIQNTPTLTTPDDTLLFYFNYEGSKLTAAFNGAADWHLSSALGANVVFGVEYTNLSWDNAGSVSGHNRGDLNGIVYFLGRDYQGNSGYFTEGRLGVNDQLFFTAGVRMEQNPNFGPDYGFGGKAIAPRVGVSWVRGLGGLTLKTRASYGKAIRPPSYTALAGSVQPYQIYLPNPKIAPEAQVGGDLGAELYASHASFEVTYFNQRAIDLIDAVLISTDTTTSPPTLTSQLQNVGRIRNTGWEFAGHWSPGPFDLRGTLSITNSTVQKVSPTYQGELQVGDRLLSIPKYSGGVTLQYNHSRGFARAEVTYVSSLRGVRWYDWYVDYYVNGGSGLTRPFWTDYPGFVKANLGVGFDVAPQLSPFLRVENLFNSRAIELDDSYTPRGRVVTAGVRVKT